jgi:meso-butanediol dehydrogenase/(S,S)-butanediol dehydrogenase/diacetyl reductase
VTELRQRFAGKRALVTGGNSGIGAAIAQRLAQEGAAVAICARRAYLLDEKVAQLQAAGAQAVAISGDITVDAAHIVHAVAEELGGLDVLVNNAAVAVGMDISEMTSSAWRHVLATNLDAVFELVSHARPYLIEHTGNILHISSIGAVAGNFDDVAYAASKAGLEGFSRKLALEMAEYGVRSNVIRPGLIMTEAFAEMPSDFFETQVPLIPLGRIGQPEDIAAAAAFLCSDDARFITGAVLTIDGGESAK